MAENENQKPNTTQQANTPQKPQTKQAPKMPEAAKVPEQPVKEEPKKEQKATETEGEQQVVKKKAKVPIIAGIAVAVAVLAIVGIFAFMRFKAANDIKNQLKAGDKYLTELDYENAILAYEKVLEMDPNNEEAYLKIGDIYFALAAKAEAVPDYDKTLEYLNTGKDKMEEGVKRTNSTKIKKHRDKFTTEIDRINRLIKQLAEEEEARLKAEEEARKKAEEEKNKPKEEVKPTEPEEEKPKEEKPKEEKPKQEQPKQEKPKQEEKKSEPVEQQPAGDSYYGSVEVERHQVSYKVDGNHVALTVNMQYLIEQINEFKHRGGWISDRPDAVQLATVSFSDGVLEYTCVYRLAPAYATDDPYDTTVDPANSKFQSYLTVNGNWLCTLSPYIEGDTLNWSFDLPSGYNLNDRIHISGCTENDYFVSY